MFKFCDKLCSDGSSNSKDRQQFQGRPTQQGTQLSAQSSFLQKDSMNVMWKIYFRQIVLLDKFYQVL